MVGNHRKATVIDSTYVEFSQQDTEWQEMDNWEVAL